MADTSTEPIQTQEPSGAPVFQGAVASDLKIISKNGQAVEPAHTPEPVVAATPTPAVPAPGTAPAAAAMPVTPTPTPLPTDQPGPDGIPGVDGEPAPIDFFQYLGEQTNGRYSSADHVLAAMDELETLRTKLAEKPKIEFANEQAKQIYEFANKFPGMEMSAARNYLHVQSLDIKTLNEKEAQFEAFALENNDITRDKARGYFEAMYEKKYGNDALQNDLTAQFEHQRETKKAKDSLSKLQSEFAKEQPSQQAAGQPTTSPEEIAEIQQNVQRVMEDFGGVSYNYFNDPNSAVNIPLEEADQQRFETYLSSPQSLLQDLMGQCSDKEGHFNYELYRNKMFEFANIDRVKEQTFAQGVNYGKLLQIKEIKNTKTPKEAEAPPPGPKEPATFKEAWSAAMKPRGKAA